MKLNLSIIVSFLTLVLGLIFSKTSIFIPFSVVIASIIDLSTRQWIKSSRLGGMTSISVLFKFVFSLNFLSFAQFMNY